MGPKARRPSRYPHPHTRARAQCIAYAYAQYTTWVQVRCSGYRGIGETGFRWQRGFSTPQQTQAPTQSRAHTPRATRAYTRTYAHVARMPTRPHASRTHTHHAYACPRHAPTRALPAPCHLTSRSDSRHVPASANWTTHFWPCVHWFTHFFGYSVSH